jgi:hypothetical protein
LEKDYESILPESSTQLVSLNTRVPRFVSKMIDESVGMLQVASIYQKVSKQVAIQILIERGYQAIREDFVSMDLAESEVAVNIESVETIEENLSEQLVSNSPAKQSRESYDMKAYAEFSNKSVYEPRKPPARNSQNEKPKFLQNLGLR